MTDLSKISDLDRLLKFEHDRTIAVEMNYDTYKINQKIESLKAKIEGKIEDGNRYLVETCGYCHEKMILIGSRHIHACKHDLLDDERKDLIDKNKDLESQVVGLTQQVGDLMSICDMKDESIAKLKEELVSSKYAFDLENRKVEQLKSALDEIKKWYIDNLECWKEEVDIDFESLRKALAKHEDKQ